MNTPKKTASVKKSKPTPQTKPKRADIGARMNMGGITIIKESGERITI